MCSQGDDPTTYDAPEPTRPRTYRLSGDRYPDERSAEEILADLPGRGSVALAVLGEMLTDLQAGPQDNRGMWYDAQEVALREARDRIAAAEELERLGYRR